MKPLGCWSSFFVGLLAIFAVLATIILIGSIVGRPPASTQDDPDKAYLKAAYTFLIEDLKSAQEIAETMNHLNSGYVKLSQIRDTLETAKGFHASIWVDTLMGKSPPVKYQALHQQIRSAELLRYNSLKELLLYWQDQNGAHIDNGMKIFARSIAAENNCLKKLNSATDAIKSKKP